MRLMDFMCAYLYGSLDTNIYMKVLKGFKLPENVFYKVEKITSWSKTI